MDKRKNAADQPAQSHERQLRFGSMMRKLLLPSGSRRWITPIVMLLLLLGILLGIASAGVGRLLTAMGSRYYARKLRGRLQTGVEKAVQSCVVAPVQQEAKCLNAYRKALDI